MARFRIVAVAAVIAVVMDVVCMGLWMSAGFPLGPLLYYPAYALLYPAFLVHSLIPNRCLTIDEHFVIDLALPFIEFFIVALVVLEVRRRLVEARNWDSK